MKKLITTLTNIWKVEELRKRILYTLLLLFIYRVGCHVVLPGVNPEQLMIGGRSEGTDILDIINMFAGGAFSAASIFALGVMPYISASIVIQLLGIAVPSFQKMQKEGESGRKKLTQITRYLTVAITLVQAIAYVRTQITPDAKLIADPMFTILAAIVLTAGTLFVMWLGERITDKGIGNGISLIIMVGIIAQLPAGISAEWASRMGGQGGPIPLLLEFIILFFVVIFTIMVVQGVRKIPVQYAKKIVGNKQVGGVRQYIPLKVNAAGVMPIIFAQAIMFLPMTLVQFFPDVQSDFLNSLSNYTSFTYNLVFGLLIIAFTFFYTAIMVNPQQMSEDMKKNGGFIPGVKPGHDTNLFIDNVISHITFPGAIFVAIIAILPAIAALFGVNNQFAHFFGGTSLLILVGVVLDTLQQIESHLLMRHYDGLMKSGRVKGRSAAPVEGVNQSTI